MQTNQLQVRTDLAVEMKQMIDNDKDKQGTRGIEEITMHDKNIKITEIIVNEQGAKAINRAAGTYVTVFTDSINNEDSTEQANAASVVSKQIKKLMDKNKVKNNDKVLVVGLGNQQVTPDALGPLTVERTVVTNHLFELDYEDVSSGYRRVIALTPGVMGITGMETSDIIFSVVKQFSPDCVIVIDALAAKSVSRLNKTIQITDTGIHPGSGVQNKRKEISFSTLNIPVIAIGVPTVVDAVTIASDTLDTLLKHLGRNLQEHGQPRNSLIPTVLKNHHKNLSDTDLPDEDNRQAILGLVGNLSDSEKRELFAEVLSPLGDNLIVTPKDIDSTIQNIAVLLARAINAALHQAIEREDAANFTK